jgi:clan AA aspartic protease
VITGTVTADREAIVRLTVRGPGGRTRRVTAEIDTGFDGWLSLPPPLVTQLGLPWRRRGRSLLADGREGVFDIYEATVVWDRRRLRIPVDEADTTPLIGMALLDGYELNVQVRAGGAVTIKPLRRRR